MSERNDKKDGFTPADGLSLTLAYLEDPSDVECPSCGPDHIEVVGFVDADSLDAGEPRAIAPESDYAVILFCHGCERAAALHLSFQARPGLEAA